MNKIERQILENQKIQMELSLGFGSVENIKQALYKTKQLLNQKEQDEECSDGLSKEFVNSGGRE